LLLGVKSNDVVGGALIILAGAVSLKLNVIFNLLNIIVKKRAVMMCRNNPAYGHKHKRTQLHLKKVLIVIKAKFFNVFS
jgi:hypothetical protein